MSCELCGRPLTDVEIAAYGDRCTGCVDEAWFHARREQTGASQDAAQRNKLEHSAFKKARLIRELARGNKSQRQIARDFDVTESAIRQFRDRHMEEIEDSAAELQRGLDALWITDKLERLAHLQGELAALENREEAEFVRLRLDILRKAAEELGDIPNKVAVNLETPVDIRLIGVDPDRL